ncbi:AAA family ATPase [Dactylosporangium siamense]|uniref:helix-turn-helix transcriptional regulator n=1 Tax=Dactylosporangium siamense TaxID=685454 RepID=UPI00360BEDEB
MDSVLARAVATLHDDGDLRTARALFERAWQESPGDPLAALGLAGLWVHEHRDAAAGALLERRLTQALAAAPPGPLRTRLRARLAAEAGYRDGSPDAVLAVVEEARAGGDPVALAEALSLAHHCLLGPAQAGLRHRLGRELLGVAAGTGRRGDLLMGMLWHTADLFLAGDLLAERRLAALTDALADRDHLAVGYVAAAMRVMLSIRAGRLDHAEWLAAGCADRGRQAGDEDTDGWHGGQLMAIRWFQGRITELLPMFDDLAHAATLSVVDRSPLAGLAVAAAAAGDRARAAAVLARIRGAGLAHLPTGSSWLVTLYGVVEAAHLLGDAGLAAEAAALLAPHARLPMTASLGIACFGAVEHALGVAALTTGDLDAAVAHFRAAVRDNQTLGHRPAALHSRRRLAEALRRRVARGDVDAARRELDTAAVEAADLDVAAGVEELVGRDAERARLLHLAADAREGHSRGVVVSGPPGIGKTTLLDDLATAAHGFRVVRAAGVEFEADLPFAALAALTRPLLPLLEQLPAAQAAALRGAFGLSDDLAAAPVERFAVGAATLSLLAAAADDRPLLCLVDDAHWLDRASAEALLFATRRLLAEPVLVVFATRSGAGFAAPGTATVDVGGLDGAAGAKLLRRCGIDSTTVAERLLAATEGNPLALRELAGALIDEQRAGRSQTGAVSQWLAGLRRTQTPPGPTPVTPGYNPGVQARPARPDHSPRPARRAAPDRPSPGAEPRLAPTPTSIQPLAEPLPTTDRIERAFTDRVAALAGDEQAALLVCAAAGTGTPALLARALTALWLSPSALDPAIRAGLLLEDGGTVRFRHPLVRSAVYHRALPAQRRAAHAALAGACVTADDADRRAWHLSLSLVGPDDAVADALDQTAGRARRRGGLVAEATALERAAAFTVAPEPRGERLARAAHTWTSAGAVEHADALLDDALRLVTGARGRLRALAQRGYIAMLRDDPDEALAAIVAEVDRCGEEEPLQAARSLSLAVNGPMRRLDVEGMLRICTRAVELAGDVVPHPDLPKIAIRLAHAAVLAARPEGALLARRSVAVCLGDVATGRDADGAAAELGDVMHWIEEHDTAGRLFDHDVDGARRLDDVSLLAYTLPLRARLRLRTGRVAAAYADALEGLELAETMGLAVNTAEAYTALAQVEAVLGRHDSCAEHAAAALGLAPGHLGVEVYARSALGVAALTAGRHDDAVAELGRADDLLRAGGVVEPAFVPVAADLAEALVKSGQTRAAHAVADRLAAAVAATGLAGLAATSARVRALLADTAAAYESAVAAFTPESAVAAFTPESAVAASTRESAVAASTRESAVAASTRESAVAASTAAVPLPVELGRTHLAYGQWLRRNRRRGPAREHLTEALDLFTAAGADAFAELARAELTPSSTRTGPAGSAVEHLTPHEWRIAYAAAEGRTSREIADRIVLSVRTVDYHLGNVYRKLGIRSRRELIALLHGVTPPPA